MEEEFISGYCRALDGVRTVTAEKDGDVWCVDCGYGSCPYEGNCQIARRIRQLEE